MITEEEWQKLKIGHVIYVVYDSNDVQLIKTTISKITKAQIKLECAKLFYVQTYNKSQSARLFTDAYNAYKYGINLLSEKQKELHEKIKKIESNKSIFANKFEKLEQENADIHPYWKHISMWHVSKKPNKAPFRRFKYF